MENFIDKSNPGVLTGCRVYLVGSMEYLDGQPWREYVKKEFAPIGIKTFDPYKKPFCNSADEGDDIREVLHAQMRRGRFDDVARYMREVRNDDLRLCDIADFFIVNISPKIASWGGAEELYWANRQKKMILLVVEGGKQNTPLWIMGTIPHEHIFDTIEDAVEHIKKLNLGEIPLEPRWKILKPEYR